jgi:ELWxxDGT repeat protein
MAILVGDTLYFDAKHELNDKELWAHDTSNSSTWQVADINNISGTGSNPGNMAILVGDTIYFDANDGISGNELWAHDTSNSSTWQVADINNGSLGSYPGSDMAILVGDTLYFGANDGSNGYELWMHDISSSSTWLVANINNIGGTGSDPGYHMVTLVGDTLYFSANDGSTPSMNNLQNPPNKEIWAMMIEYSIIYD